MIIYGDMRSGNCLKVKYTADRLGLGYEWIDVDIMAAGSRTPDFLAMNQLAKYPVCVLKMGALWPSRTRSSCISLTVPA